MPNSSPFIASAECLKLKSSCGGANLVYESLCKFRTLKIKRNSGASHNFTVEAEEATPRECKRQKSLTTDEERTAPSNNVNPEQRSESILEAATVPKAPLEELSLQGSDVALQFAREVVLKLDEKELDQFIRFLTKEDMDNDTTNLQQLLTDEIEHFCEQETSFTKEDVSGIAQPAGRPDCDLGLILHCQSREGGVTKFWDEGSQTIQLLSQKGLGPDIVFAYDWHWRGEARARGRKSTCPASSWKKQKLYLHNQMSRRLLDILPLPLMIVAGRCAKKHYQETRSYSAKEVNVKLKGNVLITFEILFEQQSVRRIAAFVDHPAATMFNPNSAAQYCLRLDAALNFMMWLVALPHDEKSFTETGAKIRRGRPGSAPLKEVHEYVNMEASLMRPLTVLEYDPVFLNWASTTLQEDAFRMLDAGQSVAKALRSKINDSISKSLQQSRKFSAANRRRNADRYGFEFKEFWDAEEVTVTAKGYISLHLSEERCALKLLIPLRARKRCLAAQKKNEKTMIFFTKTGVELRLKDGFIFALPIEELRRQRQFGLDGVNQYYKELAQKGTISKEN